MANFFGSWRRRIGAVTLAIACLCTGAWLRSSVVEDQFVLTRAGNSLQWMIFSARGVTWTMLAIPESCIGDFEFRNDSRFWTTDRVRDAFVPYGVKEIPVIHSILGVEFMVYCDLQYERYYCIVPYQLIIIPLTLISAYLLLFQFSGSKTPKSPLVVSPVACRPEAVQPVRVLQQLR